MTMVFWGIRLEADQLDRLKQRARKMGRRVSAAEAARRFIDEGLKRADKDDAKAARRRGE